MSSSDAAGLWITLAIWVIAIAACFVLAIIPSKIAKRKGYSGVGFYFFGLAALVPAIIVASVLRNKNASQSTLNQPPQQ